MSRAGACEIVPERDIGRSSLLRTSARKIQASRSRFRPSQEAWISVVEETVDRHGHSGITLQRKCNGPRFTGGAISDASSRISAHSMS